MTRIPRLAGLFLTLLASRGMAQPAGGLPASIGAAGRLPAQVEALKGSLKSTQGSLEAVSKNVGRLAAIGESYPAAVDAMRTRAGLAPGATVVEEVQAYTRIGLEKSGVDPRQARSISKAVGGIEGQARQFNVLDPKNIALMVGITAGANVISQLAGKGEANLSGTFGFLTDKRFWGGLAGSSLAYSAAGYLLTALVPAGGGVLRALLPTFAAMTAGLIGWNVGSRAFDEGVGGALAGTPIAEIVGQAAGSTLGLFLGPQLLAGLGAWGGPVGAIAGAMILGTMGRNLVANFKEKFREDPDKAVQDGLKLVTKGLAGLAAVDGVAGVDLASSTRGQLDAVREVKALHDRAYQDFLEADRTGDRERARQAYQRLASLSSALDAVVKDHARPYQGGHRAPR